MAKPAILWIILLVTLLTGCAVTPQETRSSRERAAEINTELGMTYLQQGDNNQAMDSLTKALEQDADNYLAHATKAVLHERLEQYDQARTHFRRSIRLKGDDPSVRNNYGRFLCNRGEYDAGLAEFERAIADPLYERRELPLANAGQCALDAGKVEVAEDYLLRALREEPQFAPALRRMARLRFESDDALGARGYIQRYREVSQMDAADLWLAVRIERSLRNLDEAASYGLRLRADYPDSEEARLYNRMRNDDRS